MTSDFMERDLKRYHLHEEETPHSNVGVVDTPRQGNSLSEGTALAAWNYAKGLKHLLPKNFDWKDAGVDVQGKEDLKNLATQKLSWKAFSSDGVSL